MDHRVDAGKEQVRKNMFGKSETTATIGFRI